MSQQSVAELRAPGKINIALHITGRRADGYHELDMLNCTVSLADRLWVRMEDGDEVRLEMSPSGSVCLPVSAGDFGSSNLATRAAVRFLSHFGIRRRITITLEKHVPVGAGMGGGSSDAAVILRHLWRTLCPSKPISELHTIALSLGTDVPYFLHGGLCRVSGVGEVVTPVSVGHGLVPRVLLLIAPWSLATPDVYQRYRELTPAIAKRNIVAAWQRAQQAITANELIAAMQNDLEAAVDSMAPDCGRVRSAVYEQCGIKVAVTGSGSAMFTLLAPSHAEAQAETVAKVASGYGVSTKLLSLEPESERT